MIKIKKQKEVKIEVKAVKDLGLSKLYKKAYDLITDKKNKKGNTDTLKGSKSRVLVSFQYLDKKFKGKTPSGLFSIKTLSPDDSYYGTTTKSYYEGLGLVFAVKVECISHKTKSGYFEAVRFTK